MLLTSRCRGLNVTNETEASNGAFSDVDLDKAVELINLKKEASDYVINSTDINKSFINKGKKYKLLKVVRKDPSNISDDDYRNIKLVVDDKGNMKVPNLFRVKRKKKFPNYIRKHRQIYREDTKNIHAEAHDHDLKVVEVGEDKIAEESHLNSVYVTKPRVTRFTSAAAASVTTPRGYFYTTKSSYVKVQFGQSTIVPTDQQHPSLGVQVHSTTHVPHHSTTHIPHHSSTHVPHPSTTHVAVPHPSTTHAPHHSISPHSTTHIAVPHHPTVLDLHHSTTNAPAPHHSTTHGQLHSTTHAPLHTSTEPLHSTTNVSSQTSPPHQSTTQAPQHSTTGHLTIIKSTANYATPVPHISSLPPHPPHPGLHHSLVHPIVHHPVPTVPTLPPHLPVHHPTPVSPSLPPHHPPVKTVTSTTIKPKLFNPNKAYGSSPAPGVKQLSPLVSQTSNIAIGSRGHIDNLFRELDNGVSDLPLYNEDKDIKLLGPIAVRATGPTTFEIIHPYSTSDHQTHKRENFVKVQELEKPKTTKRPSLHFEPLTSEKKAPKTTAKPKFHPTPKLRNSWKTHGVIKDIYENRRWPRSRATVKPTPRIDINPRHSSHVRFEDVNTESERSSFVRFPS